jgi:hypothetical protein
VCENQYGIRILHNTNKKLVRITVWVKMHLNDNYRKNFRTWRDTKLKVKINTAFWTLLCSVHLFFLQLQHKINVSFWGWIYICKIKIKLCNFSSVYQDKMKDKWTHVIPHYISAHWMETYIHNKLQSLQPLTCNSCLCGLCGQFMFGETISTGYCWDWNSNCLFVYTVSSNHTDLDKPASIFIASFA